MKNFYLDNNFMNFKIDIHFAPGFYEISILKRVDTDTSGPTDPGGNGIGPGGMGSDNEYVALENTGGLTHINITILSTYTVNYLNPGSLTIYDAQFASEVTSGAYQIEICDKICQVDTTVDSADQITCFIPNVISTVYYDMHNFPDNFPYYNIATLVIKRRGRRVRVEYEDKNAI